MRKTLATVFLLFAVAIVTPIGVSADPIVYITLLVSVDSSSVSGMSGNLDFQFAPGIPAPLPATAAITDFAGGVISGAPATSGSVTGTLPGSVLIGNSVAGDYFQPFTYGNSLTFTVVLTEMPNLFLGGNTFAFSMFDNGSPLHPVLTTNLADGFAFESTSSGNVNFSKQTKLIVALPEAASSGLAMLGLASLLGFMVRRRV